MELGGEQHHRRGLVRHLHVRQRLLSTLELQFDRRILRAEVRRNTSGTVQISYAWRVHWVASTNAPAAARATVKVKLFANLADLTVVRWKIGGGIPPFTAGKVGFQGNVTTVVVRAANGTWASSGGPASFVTRLTTHLRAGDQYAFYTGVFVFVEIRGFSPHCFPSMKLEVGVNGPGAFLKSIRVR